MNDFIKHQQQMERYIQKTTNPMHKLFDIQRQLTQFAQYPKLPLYQLISPPSISNVSEFLCFDLYDNIKRVTSHSSYIFQGYSNTLIQQHETLLYTSFCELNNHFENLFNITQVNNKTILSIEDCELFCKKMNNIYNILDNLNQNGLLDFSNDILPHKEVKLSPEQCEQIRKAASQPDTMLITQEDKNTFKDIVIEQSVSTLIPVLINVLLVLISFVYNYFSHDPNFQELLKNIVDFISKFQ